MKSKKENKNLRHSELAIPNLGIVQIIWSKPVTIVILPNGVKGISRCRKGDVFNNDVGFFLAFADAYEKSHCLELEENEISYSIP